jgi:hypothetical protein
VTEGSTGSDAMGPPGWSQLVGKASEVRREITPLSRGIQDGTARSGSLVEMKKKFVELRVKVEDFRRDIAPAMTDRASGVAREQHSQQATGPQWQEEIKTLNDTKKAIDMVRERAETLSPMLATYNVLIGEPHRRLPKRWLDDLGRARTQMVEALDLLDGHLMQMISLHGSHGPRALRTARRDIWERIGDDYGA